VEDLRFRIAAAAAALLLGAPLLRAAAVIELQPEIEQTLHVGDVAVMRLPARLHYSIGGAGESLRLVKRTHRRGLTVYRYRTVRAGHQTFVLTPRAPGPDGCISCVTVHYFVTVVR